MSGVLLDASAWIRPFGFVRAERRNEDELDVESAEWALLSYAVLIVLDVLTLPLAVVSPAVSGDRG